MLRGECIVVDGDGGGGGGVMTSGGVRGVGGFGLSRDLYLWRLDGGACDTEDAP